jgi:hypothetical protein
LELDQQEGERLNTTEAIAAILAEANLAGKIVPTY